MTTYGQVDGNTHRDLHSTNWTYTGPAQDQGLHFHHEQRGTHKSPLLAEELWWLKPAGERKPVLFSETVPGWVSVFHKHGTDWIWWAI